LAFTWILFLGFGAVSGNLSEEETCTQNGEYGGEDNGL
jgi:hypothetical protein